jgi:hypothetical protein
MKNGTMVIGNYTENSINEKNENESNTLTENARKDALK